MSLTAIFASLALSSQSSQGEMFPSLLTHWQSLIIYLLVTFVVAWLIIANAAASSAEQNVAAHGSAPHADEMHSAAALSSRAATLPVGAQEAAPTSVDDLKVIEGIGPKIASVLQAAGINSFTQLSETDPAHLEAILREAGLRLADPATWPEQARLAAAGDWTAFDALTARLKGGRQV